MNVLKNVVIVSVMVLTTTSSRADDLPESNAKPLAFGSDQTIVDINHVKWEPLTVKGLEGSEIALLRGSVEKGGAEALLRFPPNYKVANHSHTSDETYVWLSGSFTLVSFKGERTKFEGPAFISFPGNAPPHGLECGPGAPCILYVRYGRPFDINYFPEPPAPK